MQESFVGLSACESGSKLRSHSRNQIVDRCDMLPQRDRGVFDSTRRQVFLGLKSIAGLLVGFIVCCGVSNNLLEANYLVSTSATWRGVQQDEGLFPAAENESPEAERERTTAERFFALLQRRPRLGTALDKVYGYHVGRGSLDEFTKGLEEMARAEDDGNLWMVLGMVHMQRGQDSLAVEALTQASDALSDQYLAHYYLGKSLVLIGDIDLAAEKMRQAIDSKPPRTDAVQIFQDLGRIYQRTGRNEEALEVWTELEALFPEDTGVREQIATILADEGAEEEALKRYEELAESISDRYRQIEMGIRAAGLKAKLGQTDQAIEDYEGLLAIVNPESWLHRDIRGRIEEIFWSSGNIDGLVDYYEAWVEEHPDDVDAMMRTARSLAVQKRLPEAKTWFRRAIERAPTVVESRQALIEALANDEQFKEAADEMEALVELEPNNPDFIVRWGELAWSDQETAKEERREKAAGIWSQLVDNRSDDPVTISTYADLLRSVDLEDKAIEQYEKAIELAANEPQYREYLGEYLHQLKRTDEAIKVWQDLAAGERRTRGNLVRLSEVFGAFGYDERALATMAEACELDPGFAEFARYAELLRLAGKHEEALAQLDLAEPLAEDRELLDLVINERIANYSELGTLDEKIANQEELVAGDAKEDPAAWRLLALMREANSLSTPW